MEDIIANLICSIGLGISLLLTISLFSRKKLYLSFLGLLFFAFFSQLTEEWLWISGLIKTNLYILEVTECTIFISAPAFYLFAKYQIKKDFQWEDLLHFLPVLLVFANFFPLYIADESVKICYVRDKLDMPDSSYCANLLLSKSLYFVKEEYLDLLNIIQIVIYVILAIPYLRDLHAQKAKKLEGTYINWAKILLIIALLAILSVTIDVLWIDTKYDTFSVMYLTAICGFISFYLMKRTLLFADNLRTNSYSNLSQTEIDSIYNTVYQYLQKDGVYSKNNTNLSLVAQLLEIPRNKIQFAFNKKGKSLNEELNRLRIRKAKELLDKDNPFTIESIGEEVGYSSKATFYKYFKKYERMTPKQYLEKMGLKRYN